MSYTRLDLGKRHKGKKQLMYLCSVIIFSVVVGSGIFNFISKEQSKNTFSPSKGVKVSSSYRFVALSVGVYTNDVFAKEAKDSLKSITFPFAVLEGGKTKIFHGIYTVDDGSKISKDLNGKSIDNSPIVYEINCGKEEKKVLSALISANISILNKLREKEVTSIKTEEFKKWAANQKIDGDKEEEMKNILGYKEYINKLPKEITKDNIEGNYEYIYTLLKKISVEKKYNN